MPLLLNHGKGLIIQWPLLVFFLTPSTVLGFADHPEALIIVFYSLT